MADMSRSINIKITFNQIPYSTELRKYYAWLQTAVLAAFACRLAGYQGVILTLLSNTHCYFGTVSEQMVTHSNVHLQSGNVSIY